MSSEWRKATLGSLCEISSSKRIYAKEYCEDGIAFYRGKEIIEKAHGSDISTELYISLDRFDELKAKFGAPVEGDILLTAVGTLGVPYLVKKESFYFKDGNLVWFRNFTGALSKYIFLWLQSPEGQKQIEINSIGSTQRAITIDALKKFDILLPPFPEQKAIAAVLSALDDKIELNNRINQKLEEMAQALFKSWFVNFEPWGGKQPTSWTIGKAEDFFDISIGKTPPRKEAQWFTTNPQDTIWASISDMGKCGAFISDSSEYLTAEAVSKFNIKVVPSGTVLLSFKLTVGRVAISNGQITTNEAIAHFKRSETTAMEYLYCYLKVFDYQSLGSTSSIATAVNSKTIKAMPFVMPGKKALEEFHTETAPLFEQIKVHLEESARLSTLRDALLPKLMSGELRVPCDSE